MIKPCSRFVLMIITCAILMSTLSTIIIPASASESGIERSQSQVEKQGLFSANIFIRSIAMTTLQFLDFDILQSGRTVLTIGDTNYTAADVQYYYMQTYHREYYYSKNYWYYGLAAFDYSKAPEDQIYSTDDTTGKVITYQDYFVNTAVDDLTQITAVVNEANKAGYTLSQSGIDAVADQIASVRASADYNDLPFGVYLKMLYGDCMTIIAYEKCLKRAELVTEYYNTYCDLLTYDNARLQSYYDENKDALDTYEYSYLLFYTSDEEQDTDFNESKSANKANADAVLAALRSGEDINALIDKYTPYSCAVDATTVGNSLSDTYGVWLKDPSRMPGDIEILEYNKGGNLLYYVIVFYGRYLDETPTADFRTILIKAADSEDDATAATDEQLKTAYDTANSLLNQWQVGEKTAESFCLLAKEYSDDTSSASVGGLYENIAEGQMFDPLNQWIMDPSRQHGDTTLIESTTESWQQGWNIVYFQSWDNPFWMNNAENDLRSEDVSHWLDSITDALTVNRTEFFNTMVGKVT